MPTIVVNATALDQSGALTILKQFIEAIPPDGFSYLIFVSDKLNLVYSQENIQLVPMAGVKSFFRRFMWDTFGVKKWLKLNQVEPVASVSLQNTNFRTGNRIPNFIYYHQSIPFVNTYWSLFKKQERPMWFYKNIYPFFVGLFINNKTEVFVQLKFIKDGFSKRFNFPVDKIHVIAPKTNLLNLRGETHFGLDADKINLFYPATPFFYKNHEIILKALSKLDKNKYALYLTCQEGDLENIYDNVTIHFMGVVPFKKVIDMYLTADALIFPSYIETYGLPLIEAANFGLPVLVADLPYSREVLNGYEGVRYIGHKNVQQWIDAIKELQKGKRYKSYTQPKADSWRELFEILTRNL